MKRKIGFIYHVYSNGLQRIFESRGGVLNFIAQYVNPEERKAINKSQIKISYLDYNWKINGQ